MSEKLMEYFNKQPRLGTLSTADKAGNVNVAYFGSPRMVDEKTVFMGLGNNRTFANLQDNSKAVYMIMEPGESLPEWKGVRFQAERTTFIYSTSNLRRRKLYVLRTGRRLQDADT